MPKFDDFSKRMKRYEKSHTELQLIPRCPVVIRLDGKAFHTYTKKFKKELTDDPFSNKLHDAFVYASKNTAKEISGCKAVYTQSDEVSFWLNDEGKSVSSQGWFDFNLQKMVSVSTSIFTAYFNSFIGDEYGLGFFDARAFSLPNETELNNYFIWRQQDASRNSVSMTASYFFSHKQLHKLSCNEMQDKLMVEKGVNWNDLDVWKKRGSLVIKQYKVKTATNYKTGLSEDVVRSSWEEIECPLFTKSKITEIIEDNNSQKGGL
jgi:tRNA(His) guanylyltransferase